MLVRSGEWNTPSKEQKQILALTAKLETMAKKKKGKRNEEVNKKYEWKESGTQRPTRHQAEKWKQVPLVHQAPNVDTAHAQEL